MGRMNLEIRPLGEPDVAVIPPAFAALGRPGKETRRGYLPDGRGIVCRGIPVEPGATVRLDDDVALMMTRRLS